MGVHRCAQVMQVCSGVLVYVPVCSRDSHGSGVLRCAARRCKVSSSPGRGRDKGPFRALRRSRRPETGHRQGPSALPGKLEKRCTPPLPTGSRGWVTEAQVRTCAITRPGCDPPPPSSLSRGWWPPVNSATLPARPWAGAVSPDAPARRRHPRGHHRLPPTASRRFRAKGGRVRAPGNRKGRRTRPSLRARKRARHAGRGGQAAGEGPLRAGRCAPCRHHPNRSGRFRGGGVWHSKQRRREGGGSVSCFFCVCSGVLR